MEKAKSKISKIHISVIFEVGMSNLVSNCSELNVEHRSNIEIQKLTCAPLSVF